MLPAAPELAPPSRPKRGDRTGAKDETSCSERTVRTRPVHLLLAEAVAEGHGKAQAESLRRARRDTVALRLEHWNYGTNLAIARTGAVAATDLLRRNLLVHGLGGLVLPFVGINLIGLLISRVPGLG